MLSVIAEIGRIAMSTKLYVNLPVEDLADSKRFFAEMGFAFNEQWSDENVAALVIGDEAGVLLFTTSYFKTFTPRTVVDASQATEVVVSLGVESRERVDELADRALAVGGRPANDTQDLGFMYTRSFADPDGHLWEVIYMAATPDGDSR
jgi:predicted lactoylglutathione lyase